MKEFQVFQVISNTQKGGGMEVAVLVDRVVGGQKVQKSVNRHVHHEDGFLVGRHPDFYDGVDAKNTAAEEAVSRLEGNLEDLTRLLDDLDYNLDQWCDQGKFNEMFVRAAKECEQVGLKPGSVKRTLELVRPLQIQKLKDERAEKMSVALRVGVDLEHVKKHFTEIQKEFPRLVHYI